MDVPHSRVVLKKPPALQVALPTIAPLVVAVFGTEVTMVIGDQYGHGTVPFVLVGWCVVLLEFAAGD
jgi:urea transporter